MLGRSGCPDVIDAFGLVLMLNLDTGGACCDWQLTSAAQLSEHPSKIEEECPN
ncbi:hypothetical protein [Sutcliffiella horikoshii]|uniref:hypothetical protein n=1 Tax=Sutcliffiella horikoshii TaxID=79883 RepID=UPI0012FB14A0|nr:hypothetical protein [Sutcliffiella horikoshii]